MTLARVIICLLLPSLQLLSACSANDALTDRQQVDLPRIHFAGLAYLGRNDLIESSYPRTLQLDQSLEASGGLQSILLKHLNEKPPKNFHLSFDLADIRRNGQNIVLAVAVDQEQLTVEPNAQGTLTLIWADISFQLLFFDFNTMNLVANVWVDYQKNGTASAGADADAVAESLFNDLLLGEGQTESVFSKISNELHNLNLRETLSAIRFQVTDVQLSESILESMPADWEEKPYTQLLGQSLSAELAKHYRVSVLPFVNGYTFGQKMRGRFANGEIFTLEFPNTDYSMTFSLNKLIRREHNANNTIYGVTGHFQFYESHLGTVYVEDDFKYAIRKEHDEGQHINESVMYNDAVKELLSDLVVQLGNPSRSWVREHARTPETYSDFNRKKDLFYVH